MPTDTAAAAPVEGTGNAARIATPAGRARTRAELEAAGFYIFPLNPDGPRDADGSAPGKRPRVKGWADTRKKWTFRPADNVGIATGVFCDGGALLVLDVDVKNGHDGERTLELLQDLHATLPTTREHRTASGGRHLFYRVREPVASTAGKLGDGLDVRSGGGFVVAPGSTIDGKPYTVRCGGAIADAPQWLIGMCGAPRVKDAIAAEPLPGIDEKRARLRAIEYLRDDAPAAVQGDAGDDTTFRVAARVKDFGASEADALTLMLEHWNDRCAPPWTPDDLRAKVANAYHYGAERQGADAPEAVFGAEPLPPPSEPAAAAVAGAQHVHIVDASSVQSKPIRWLWPGWLARGKLHVIAGAPGTGKTTLALSWAACVSAGRAFPDGTKPKPGRVLIWSGEDGFEDTLRPRLAAAGANLDRVHFVGDVERDGRAEPFDPARHVPALAAALGAIGDVALIIVDPLVSAVSGDSHKNAEVRRGLAPLVNLATDLDAALVGITHYSKGTQGREPLERVSGSLAFGALARLVFGTVRENTDGDDAARRYLLLRVKSNIGPDGGGFGYTIAQCRAEEGIDASRVEWGAAITGNARELLGAAEAVGEQDSLTTDAADFLRSALADGPKTPSELESMARSEGHAWRTVQRARKRAGVVINRSGSGANHRSTWLLRDPNAYQKAAHPFAAA